MSIYVLRFLKPANNSLWQDFVLDACVLGEGNFYNLWCHSNLLYIIPRNSHKDLQVKYRTFDNFLVQMEYKDQRSQCETLLYSH